MYLNFIYIKSSGLTTVEFLELLKISQRENELLLHDEYVKFTNMGLTVHVGKKTTLESLRVSPKGKAFITQATTRKFTNEYGELAEELVDLYEKHGAKLGKRTQVQVNLIWFMEETGFTPAAVLSTVKEYLKSVEHSMYLENLFWKPTSVFTAKKTLGKSHLYHLVCKRYSIPYNYLLGESDAKLKYLRQLALLKPTRGSYVFATGSLKGDKELKKLAGMALRAELKKKR